MPTLTSSTLPLAIGIIEILLGMAILASAPSTRAALPVPPSIFGTGLVLSGVASFILHVNRAVLAPRWRTGSAILVSLPLLAAAWSSHIEGLMGGVISMAVLAAVNVLSAGRGTGVSTARRMDSLIVAAFVIEAALGLLLILIPTAFRNPLDAPLLTYRVPLAIALFLGSLALAVSVLLKDRMARLAAYLTAALPLLMISTEVPDASSWFGLTAFPVVAVFLGLHSWLEGEILARGRTERHRPETAAFERTAEGIIWAVILLITLAGNVEDSFSRRLQIYGVALGASLLTFIWFRLPPGLHPRSRTLGGLLIYSLLVGFVAHLTGGLHTPLFFLFYLPILAAAWGLPPGNITLPAAIGVGAVLLEAVTAVLRGASPVTTGPIAIFRICGVLFVAIFSFLLARRAMQQRQLLKGEKEKLEAIIASMGEGLIVLDSDLRIQVWNHTATRMFGMAGADIRGRRLGEVLTLMREDGAELSEAEHPVIQALSTGSNRQRLLAHSQAKGDPVPVTLTATPYIGRDGLIGVICSLRDVMAEIEMERMRQDFFYIVSHEIRTPLTVIKGNVELILDGTLGPLEEAVRKVLNEIHGATGRLIRLVHDFLDAARLEHGKITLQIERAGLPPLVGQAINTLAPEAERKGIQLTYRSDGAPVPLALMDVEKALQVLLNLVGNSIKFTQRGGVEIWHEVRDGVVETYVKDTGVGIPQEERHRLFERFTQVGRGLTREPGGTGLGLYICRKLAERMNGAIYLKESAPGSGSTFVFALPLADGVSAGPVSGGQPAAPESRNGEANGKT